MTRIYKKFRKSREGMPIDRDLDFPKPRALNPETGEIRELE